MRLMLRLAAMVAGLLFCLPFHYLWKAAGRRSPWPRWFLRWVGRSAGMRVTVHGAPLPLHVLFVSNHSSWLDIMLIAGETGAAFVSKGDVARWPVIGWLAGLNNTIYVERAQRGAVRNQVDALRTALVTGQPVALFPEGTTEGGQDVLPFRASLLSSLVPPLPGVKLQPIAIDYGPAGREIAWVGDEPAGANAKRILSRRGTIEVAMTFLDPIDPEMAPDRKALAQMSRTAIVEALGASAAPTDRL